MGTEYSYITDEHLLRRFINFYIIKWLWKKSRRQVEDLYYALFYNHETKTANRTLYDRVLRLDDFNIEKKIEGLDKLTGLPEEYFIGKEMITVNGLVEEDWKQYADFREKRRKSRNREKSEGLENCEMRINQALDAVWNNKEKQGEIFKKIKHFAEFARRLEDDVLKERVEQVKFLIKEFDKKDLERLDEKDLWRYERVLKKHLEAVHGIRVLSRVK